MPSKPVFFCLATFSLVFLGFVVVLYGINITFYITYYLVFLLIFNRLNKRYENKQPLRFFKFDLQSLSEQRFLVYSCLVALAIRLPWLLILQFENFDTVSYGLVGNALDHKADVYTLSRYPYFPLQMYLSYFSGFLNAVTGLSYVVWVKLPAILADVFIIYILYKLVLQLTKDLQKARFSALFYTFNPLVITVSAYHGQFDSLTSLFLLLSIYYFINNKPGWTGLALGLSILTKTWTIVFAPLYFLHTAGWVAKTKLVLTVMALGIGSIILYKIVIPAADLELLVKVVTGYAGVSGYWGISGLINMVACTNLPDCQSLDISTTFLKYLLYAGWLIIYLFYVPKHSLIKSMFLLLLLFFLFSPGFGNQYLVWLIPLFLLNQDFKQLKHYTFLGSLVFLLSYIYNVFFIGIIIGLFPTSKPLVTLLFVEQILLLPLWGYIWFLAFKTAKEIINEYKIKGDSNVL